MLIGVVGPQGSGKTAISVFLSRCFAHMSPGIKIYTNASAAGDDVIKISDLGEIPFDRTPKILILDEAMFSVDSRRSSGDMNVVWSRAVAFFRKANFLAVFFATHTPAMIDARIRDQLQFMIMCRKSPDRFEYLILDMFSQEFKPFFINREEGFFNFVDFDTYDFPDPIEIDLLIERNPKLFKVLTKKDRAAKAAARQ